MAAGEQSGIWRKFWHKDGIERGAKNGREAGMAGSTERVDETASRGQSERTALAPGDLRRGSSRPDV
jgi:hypothetical protein